MTSTRATSPKLAAQVARRIESDIIAVGWPVGQLFGSESELQERYGVSRAVLREAVRIVEHHKVAHMRRGPSGGLIVQAPDATPSARALVIYLAHANTTIPDLVYARLLLEPLAAGLAARTITDRGIERLRGVLDQELGRADVDIQDELHVVIGELSGNPALALFIEVLTLLTRHYAAQRPHTDTSTQRAKAASLAAHMAVVDAVISGDAALAENRVAKHIRALGAWVDEISAQPPPLDSAPEEDVERLKLAEVVADRIRADIIRDNLSEGDLVGSEHELVARHNISRAVLREAIRLLEYHAVAGMRRGPGGGLIVTRPDPSASIETIALYLDYQGIDFDSLRLVRDAIELGGIELVVASSTRPGVAERLRDALRVNLDTPRDQLAELSHLFHTELAELTRNPVLALFQQILTALSSRHMNTGAGSGPTLSRERMAADADRIHRAITDAILAGDTAVAKHRMRRHLQTLSTEWWH